MRGFVVSSHHRSQTRVLYTPFRRASPHLLEVAALAGAFAALGLADLTEPRQVNLGKCYLWLLCLLDVDAIWYWRTSAKTDHHWTRWLIAVGVLMIGFVFGAAHPWTNWLATVTLGVIACEYVASLSRLIKRTRDTAGPTAHDADASRNASVPNAAATIS